MATERVPDPKYKAMADTVGMIFDALESGKATPEQLRARFATRPADEARSLAYCLEIAIELRKATPAPGPIPPVKNPRYRKGTAMQPAKWADCLWRPTA